MFSTSIESYKLESQIYRSNVASLKLGDAADIVNLELDREVKQQDKIPADRPKWPHLDVSPQ